MKYDDIIDYFVSDGDENEEKLISRFTTYDLYVKPGDIVFDCGSFSGSSTIYLSRLVGNRGTVISIEADPISFTILLRSIKDFKLKNVIPLNCAIANRNGRGPIYLSSLTPSANSIVKNYAKVKQQWRPPLTTTYIKFETILEKLKLPKIGFIYMNIEASEYDIIPSMEYIMREYKPIFMISSHAQHLPNHSINELYDMFTRCNYNYIVTTGLIGIPK
jgi:FkbM family methyltransferase